ncbi:MAG: hypothetical protein U0P30_07640 [Vicinamibacterales bacterium]
MGRALRRVALSVLLAVAVAGVAGRVRMQQRLGGSEAETAARVHDDVRGRVRRLTTALDGAAAEAAREGARVEAAAGGDGDAVVALFTAVSLEDAPARADVSALTIYGPDGSPWPGTAARRRSRPNASPGALRPPAAHAGGCAPRPGAADRGGGDATSRRRRGRGGRPDTSRGAR